MFSKTALKMLFLSFCHCCTSFLSLTPHSYLSRPQLVKYQSIFSEESEGWWCGGIPILLINDLHFLYVQDWQYFTNVAFYQYGIRFDSFLSSSSSSLLLLLSSISSRVSLPICGSGGNHSRRSVPWRPPQGAGSGRLQRGAGRCAATSHPCLPWVREKKHLWHFFMGKRPEREKRELKIGCYVEGPSLLRVFQITAFNPAVI